MIPLDPEEIFGLAVWEAVKRALGFAGCILIGTIGAFLSAFAASFILGFTPLAGSTFLPSLGIFTFILAPFWFITSITAIIALPNAFMAAIYYMRCDEPTNKRFLIFAGIHQFCLTGAFNGWGFDSSNSIQSLFSSAILWFFSIACFIGIIFAQRFWKNKQRCSHEEHLMTVAAENAVWREKLNNVEVIPSPPTGPDTPQARPLK